MNQYGRGLPPPFRRGFGDAPGSVGQPLQPPLQVPMPSQGQGTLPIAPEMDYFDPTRDGMDVMWYSISPIASLAPSAAQSPTIQIDSGVDFYWFATTYMTNVSGTEPQEATVSVPLISILINDTGSRKNLMNTPMPLPSLAGFGERPYRGVLPRLFRASSTIQFTLTNYGATATYLNLNLTLHGYTRPKGT